MYTRLLTTPAAGEAPSTPPAPDRTQEEGARKTQQKTCRNIIRLGLLFGDFNPRRPPSRRGSRPAFLSPPAPAPGPLEKSHRLCGHFLAAADPEKQPPPTRNPTDSTAPLSPSYRRPPAAPRRAPRRPGSSRPATAALAPFPAATTHGELVLGASTLPGRAARNLPGREHRKKAERREGDRLPSPGPLRRRRARPRSCRPLRGGGSTAVAGDPVAAEGGWRRRAGRACLPPSAPPRVT